MTLRKQIEGLQAELTEARSQLSLAKDDLYNTKNRIKDIAAENESLRQDKKWLQQMHSAVLQTMMSRKSI